MARRAEKNSRLFFTPHAKGKMLNRAISDLQVRRCIRKGYVQEEPHQDIGTGDWKFNVESEDSGDRIRVTIALPNDSRATVVTVMKRRRR